MKLFIVYEDCHGDVSYWTEEVAAQQEVARLRKNLEDDDKDLVDYYEVELNKPWGVGDYE